MPGAGRLVGAPAAERHSEQEPGATRTDRMRWAMGRADTDEGADTVRTGPKRAETGAFGDVGQLV